MTSGPEWEKVERPLLEHLASVDWETLIWSERQPSHNVDRSSDRGRASRAAASLRAAEDQPWPGTARRGWTMVG